MAEGTQHTHWRVSPLRRTDPIIGLDLRAGTLERLYADFAAFRLEWVFFSMSSVRNWRSRVQFARLNWRGDPFRLFQPVFFADAWSVASVTPRQPTAVR